MDIQSLLTLDPEDEIQYAFVKTLQNKLMQTDYMRDFEDYLYQKMLDRFNSRVKEFSPNDFLFPIKTYSDDEMNPDRFKEIICQSEVPPFIVKGYLSDVPAIKKWRFEFFRDQYSNADVAYGWRDQEGNEKDGMYGTMRDVCHQIECPKDKTIYINNTSQIFKEYPDLLVDLDVERLKALYHPNAVCAILQLFMGGPKTGVGLHCANEFNSFLMINGKKRWTFIPPQYSYALRGVISVNALNAVTEIDNHIKDFDYYEQHFPLYNRIPKFIAEIEPSDMLVFSPWWWHAIENTTDRSIAVATRWTAIKRDCFPRGNIIYQNIQRSNPEYKAYSNIFIDAVVSGELIGDKELRRDTFGKTKKSDY